MMSIDLHRFADGGTLALALAAAVADRLEAAIDARGEAVLVVSGGTTPRRLFRVLREAWIDWSAVTITLADERWLALQDVASNEGQVRRLLLHGRAARARFVGLKTDAETPTAGLFECQQRLEALPRPFDVALLGLGTDGHAASWLPDSVGLEVALQTGPQQLCAAIDPRGSLQPRMTLTLSALADTRWLAVQIEGERKKRVLDTLMAGTNVQAMPARALWQARMTPPVVYWSP